MHFFSLMTLGMYISQAVGRHSEQGMPAHDLNAFRVREEQGRTDREKAWQTDWEDETSVSMFKILGPIKSNTESAPQMTASKFPRAAVIIPPHAAASIPAFLAVEAPSAASPMFHAAPVKKMRLFFDDTVEP